MKLRKITIKYRNYAFVGHIWLGNSNSVCPSLFRFFPVLVSAKTAILAKILQFRPNILAKIILFQPNNCFGHIIVSVFDNKLFQFWCFGKKTISVDHQSGRTVLTYDASVWSQSMEAVRFELASSSEAKKVASSNSASPFKVQFRLSVLFPSYMQNYEWKRVRYIFKTMVLFKSGLMLCLYGP